MDKVRVLVTGAGSGVGQGIIKSLRKSELNLEVYVGDINELQSALYRADKAVIIPKVESENALEEFENLLNQHSIDIVLIGSEFDLKFFSANKSELEKNTKAVIVASSIELVETSDDKWKTAEFLRENDLPYGKAFLPKSVNHAVEISNELGFPLVLKSRTGTSNRNVHIIKSEASLRELFEKTPNPMMQEFINKPTIDNEYTCSIFKTKEGTLLGPFTARRSLRNGTSWVVEVKPFKNVYPLMEKLGEICDIMGSLNVQILEKNGQFIPFEFNSRFSGTTAIRSHFGFNEPEMVIRNFLLGEKVSQPEIKSGVSFRYLEEIFIDSIELDDLKSLDHKGTIEEWF